MLTKKKVFGAFEYITFILPTFIVISITTNIPFFLNIIYSFCNWNGISRKISFNGINNFIELFTDDPDFWHNAIFTFKYFGFYVIIVNILSLFIASILIRGFRGENSLRALFYMPNVIGLIVAGLMWKFVFGPGFTSLASLTGLDIFNIGWLSEPKYEMIVILITSFWQTAGFYMVIYIAGFNNIPVELKDAALIDGAYGFRRLFNITLPLIIPSITVCLFTSMTYALKLFETVLVMTNGGPAGATKTIVFNLYEEAFVRNRYGYGTAKSLILFIIVLVMTVIQLKVVKRRET